MIRAVVGAGGKTTLIRQMTKEYLAQGKTVLVTTSTHMYIEEDTLLTDDADQIIEALRQRQYVMAGRKAGNKIQALSMETYQKVCQYADVVLIEADGSKHKPVKYPGEGEPVIYDNVDEIIVVFGLHAIGKKLSEAVHRPELARQCLQNTERFYDEAYVSAATRQKPVAEDIVLTPAHIQTLVMKGYIEPLRKKYPRKRIRIKAMTDKSRMQIGCIIMASGQSRRFGSNKLLADFQGRSLIEWILAATTSAALAKRLVLTRSEEVRQICERWDIEVLQHKCLLRNEAIGLGIARMRAMDACLFCPADQPFLMPKSLEKLINAFQKKESGIFRLSYGERVGTPILFGKEFFDELEALPEKCGGAYLARKYPEAVTLIEAENELELQDIDTPQDQERLLAEASALL